MLSSLTSHWRATVGVIAIALMIWAAALIAIPKIAFGRGKVAQELADAVSGQARFRSFRNVYFPHPGCVAEGVIIRRGSDEHAPALIFMSKLTIIGSYSTVLSKRVSWMKAEGLVVTPSGDTWPENRSPSHIVIEHFIADNAILEVAGNGRSPIKLAVHHFSLDDLGSDRAMPFEVTLTDPLPPGEISSRGKLGPWSKQHGDTPVEGLYSLRGADLSALSGVGGVLSSDGKFRGSVRQLEVSGTTEAPQFEIASNHHRFPLSTRFQAEVDATNGDVILQDVRAKLADTDLDIHGAVVGDAQQHGRTATLDVVSHDGRIQDILFPFVHAPRSPIRGVTSWRAHIVLPSGDLPFERKVQLEGNFGIADARFTDPHTQEELDKASEQARGKPSDPDPADVVSDLKGQVLLENGSANFSQLSFTVPGASAQIHGVFNIVNERINLHGTVRLQARMSKATTGIKSFLLKALSPFFKKDKPQEPLPIAITGTYEHPQYSVSVTKK